MNWSRPSSYSEEFSIPFLSWSIDQDHETKRHPRIERKLNPLTRRFPAMHRSIEKKAGTIRCLCEWSSSRKIETPRDRRIFSHARFENSSCKSMVICSDGKLNDYFVRFAIRSRSRMNETYVVRFTAMITACREKGKIGKFYVLGEKFESFSNDWNLLDIGAYFVLILFSSIVFPFRKKVAIEKIYAMRSRRPRSRHVLKQT